MYQNWDDDDSYNNCANPQSAMQGSDRIAESCPRTTLEGSRRGRGDTQEVSLELRCTFSLTSLLSAHSALPRRLRCWGAEPKAHPAWLRPGRAARPSRNYSSQKAVRVREGSGGGGRKGASCGGSFGGGGCLLGGPSGSPQPQDGGRSPERPRSPGRWLGRASASGRRTGPGRDVGRWRGGRRRGGDSAEGAPRMERAMEQLNRLTRSLRRARTVELPDGERGRGAGGAGARAGLPPAAVRSAGKTNRKLSKRPRWLSFPGGGVRGAGRGAPATPRSSLPTGQVGICGRGPGSAVLLREEAGQTEVSPDCPSRVFGEGAEISARWRNPGFRKRSSCGPFYKRCLLGLERCFKNSSVCFKLQVGMGEGCGLSSFCFRKCGALLYFDNKQIKGCQWNQPVLLKCCVYAYIHFKMHACTLHLFVRRQWGWGSTKRNKAWSLWFSNFSSVCQGSFRTGKTLVIKKVRKKAFS